MPRDSKILTTLRPHEDAFFQQKEKDLIEKLRKKEAQAKNRAGIASALGVSDEEILKTLEEMGYTRDDVQVLHLLPLAVVAWADGEMEENEADKIRQVAMAWGIAPKSKAAKKVEEWIAECPDKNFVDQSLRIIRDIEMFREKTKQKTYKHDVLAYCNEVAKAAGGFLGLGRKISADEQEVIDRLSRELFDHHPAASKDIAKQLK